MVDKLRDKYWYYDGRKSILLEQYPDSAWTFLSNGPQNDELDYYKFIPTLYRAATIRGNEIAAMPFEIYKGNSEEPYDSSVDYQNKIGFMKNPYQLLQLVEMALVLTGRAYLFKERSRAAPKDLRYIIPTSVTPKIDPIKGLEYFERPVGATIQRFTTDDIVYFWMPDPYVELGPALHYPGQAAANACGVLINIDLFASHFFERGAIKAMLLTVKGMPVQAEREKLETWFQSFIGGIRNSWRAKVVNAEMVEPVVVGEGMKELENQQVTTEKREDICLALGVPQTLLFANSANFATAQQDELNFLNGTIIPECTFIASILNEQIFEPLGYHWEFLPESLDAMQEDEQSRSGALVQLVSALADPISEVAMDILGYELSDEQMAMLKKIWADKQAQAEQMAQLAAQQPEEKPEEEKPEDEGEKPNPFEEKMKIDLEKWKVKSLKRLREGESAAVEFVSDFIPAEKNAEILFNLAECKTAEDVRAVFGTNGHKAEVDPMLALVAELKRANDILEAEMKYSDDQPRDESGRWTDGGGGGSSGDEQGGDSGYSVIGQMHDEEGNSIGEVHKLTDTSNLGEYRIGVVKMAGDDKGTVLASKEDVDHADILKLTYGEVNEDEFVRFRVWDGDLAFSTFESGIIIDNRNDEERAIDNIYKALDILTNKGLSDDTKVSIDRNYGKPITTTAKAIIINGKKLSAKHKAEGAQ